MPELPDVTVYVEALQERIVGEVLEDVRLASPFVLRSFDPPLEEARGKRVLDVRRMNKRIVTALEDDLYLVVHLMISGRFRWGERGAKVPGRVGQAALDFSSGTLLLTEAAKKKRASLHVAKGEAGLAPFRREGIDTFTATLAQFRAALCDENHTLKRALTDPHAFDGIGGAYADEIMHRAKVSPVKWTSRLTKDEVARLHVTAPEVLGEWVERLRVERGDGFPEKVTAFRDEMAVHGKHKEACPVCGETVQRIRYASNETNYCPQCQTGGKLLADRGLSRLLKGDWPKSPEELEERIREQTIAPKEDDVSITVYGISTCDTCRKAKKWLAAQGHEFTWVDLRETPPKKKQVGGWVDALGAKPLRNTSGQSYRALGPEKKEWSDAQWKLSFAKDPMLLKRPVLEVGGKAVLVGFKPDDWKNVLKGR